MIYAQAGTTVEAVLMDAPTGLFPGIEWALVDPTDGSYDIPRSTTGVSNPLPDVYRVSFTAPAVVDVYLVRWFDGATVLASEELVVTAAAPASPLPAANGLIQLADLDARKVAYEDAAQAQAMIDDASAIARAYVAPVFDDVVRGGNPDVPAVVVPVVVGMVRRVLTNPNGLTMEVLGDYTYQANTNTAMLLPTLRERRLLRRAAAAFARARGIAVQPWGSGGAFMQADLPGVETFEIVQ